MKHTEFRVFDMASQMFNNSWRNSRLKSGGYWDTSIFKASIYGLDRYVPPDRIWFLRVSILK